MAHQHSASTSGLVLDRLADGITVQAPNGELVYANEAGARLCGYDSPAELLAAPLAEVMQRFELFDEEGRPFAGGLLPGRLALEGKHPPEVLIRVHERDSGTTRWSLVHALPITDPAGDVLYAVNLFRDVTERTVAAREREQLLGSERTARAAAEEAAQMLTKLEEVTQAALAHVVQGDVLDEMLRQITRLVDADTSAILLLDEDAEVPHGPRGAGLPPRDRACASRSRSARGWPAGWPRARSRS